MKGTHEIFLSYNFFFLGLWELYVGRKWPVITYFWAVINITPVCMLVNLYDLINSLTVCRIFLVLQL